MPELIDQCEVRFRSGAVELGGTLYRPRRRSVLRLCLLLSGSGPQDREQTVCGVPTFRPLARALARAGHGVFCWDDRGVGRSGGDYFASSGQQLIDDALAALEQLTSAQGFERVSLLGHSQGALIAAHLAVQNPGRIDSLVWLAGMALPGRVTLLDQHAKALQSGGWPEAEVQASLTQKERVLDTLASHSDAPLDSSEQARLRARLNRALLGETSAHALDGPQTAELKDAVDNLMEWEWRFLLAQDPAHELAALTCPVLGLFGENDWQVDAPTHAEALKRALPDHPNHRIHILPGVNHLFQAGPLGADYSRSGPAFIEPVCQAILEWLKRL